MQTDLVFETCVSYFRSRFVCSYDLSGVQMLVEKA